MAAVDHAAMYLIASKRVHLTLKNEAKRESFGTGLILETERGFGAEEASPTRKQGSPVMRFRSRYVLVKARSPNTADLQLPSKRLEMKI